jgi:pimeloyl-ACP methyl ester carboxylesterase
MTDATHKSYEELFATGVEAARRKGVCVAEPTPPIRRTCVVHGLELHFLDWQGAAPDENRTPMLLLHGALLQAHVWDFFSLDMQRQFHIHALDLPGHGDSRWEPEQDYSRARVTHDIAALIEQLDLSSLVLVGHSFGGSVAAMLAAQLQDRVRALVMIDSTLLPTGQPSVRTRAAGGPQTFGSFEEFAEHAAGLGRPRATNRVSTSLLWHARQLPDGHWTWKYDPAVRHAVLGPPDFQDVWNALRTFTGPLLFVRASRHSHLSEEAAERLRRLPNVHMVVVPDAGHNVMTDNPLTFTREVRSFATDLGLITQI